MKINQEEAARFEKDRLEDQSLKKSLERVSIRVVIKLFVGEEQDELNQWFE